MKLVDEFIKAVRSAAVFNKEVQVAPACILWPDRDRQWETAMPRLQEEMPELLILGDYKPEARTGPAIWLRCQLSATGSESSRVPVLYLPGVSRQDLRAVEGCPDHLKPLAELQFRGVIWSQVNAKDWTILAWLKTDQGGLGLDVSQDNDTRRAMHLALNRLLNEDLELLKGKRLEKDYFNTLLTGGDPIRDLLQWLDQGEAFRSGRSENEWLAFVEVCRSQLAFNPQKDGLLAGAARLAAAEGPWRTVWERYCEAARRFPGIPAQIRKCKMPADDLFSNEETHGNWPQWNETREIKLREDLKSLNKLPAHEARKKILEFEQEHSRRRNLIWSELNEAPLAKSLKHLAILADVTRTSLAAGNPSDMAALYRNHGWKADNAMLQALAEVEKTEDVDAVSTAVCSIYQTWLEEASRHLQKVWEPGQVSFSDPGSEIGQCIIFVDGLRFDCARRLAEILEKKGLTVETKEQWAALPSVTGTGKPAVAPIKSKEDLVAEEADGFNFEILSSSQFNKAVEASGYKILDKKSRVESTDLQNIWCECGNIDHEGHDRGARLARQLDTIFNEIAARIIECLGAGHKSVRVVTDHGWLLLPGGLPKIELPHDLSETKWGRCAAIKEGAANQERLFPWHWNQNRHFALADGISCYKKGLEYSHGGLSLQECLTLELKVMGGATATAFSDLEITDVKWSGLRCKVAATGNFTELKLDIRLNAGDPGSSVLLTVKKFNENGMASVVVENEDLVGKSAVLTVLADDGNMVLQQSTVIGGGQDD